MASAANEPLSAIDWLAVIEPVENTAQPIDEPSKTTDATAPDVSVIALDAPSVSGVGLLSREVTGLPLSLWENSQAGALNQTLASLPVTHPLPAAQAQLFTLLLAEANPPKGDPDSFLDHRLSALTDRGAAGAAAELMRLLPDADKAALTNVRADLALLGGDTTGVCADVAAQPLLTPNVGLRVYCLAQSGAWDEAVTTLNAASALGDISKARTGRLMRFLDPELAEDLPVLPPPSAQSLTALDYRLMSASGDPLPAAGLPLRFAVNDLSGDAGWRAKIEAHERLVRAGAVGEARLFAAYGEQVPAASGGVWDRAAAIQKLDQALAQNDLALIEQRLSDAWRYMQARGLTVHFAKVYGEPLLEKFKDAPQNSEILTIIALLVPEYERHARELSDTTGPSIRFAVRLATGAPEAPVDAKSRALHAAWQDRPLPIAAQRTAETGRTGETILMALNWLADGAEGDFKALTDGLVTLRALGLEDTARRAALQVWLGGDTL